MARRRTDGPTLLLSGDVRGCRRRHEQRGRGVDADAVDGQQSRCRLLEQRGDLGVKRRDLCFEVGHAVGQRAKGCLGGRDDHIGRACRTKPLGDRDELGDGEAFESTLELIRGAEGELTHLGERFDARPSCRALGHDEYPDGLDGSISTFCGATGLPDSAARAASTASSGSDLPLCRRAWRFCRSTSTTAIPARAR